MKDAREIEDEKTTVCPVVANNVEVYKIVGDEYSTVRSYNEACRKKEKGLDWEALYTQFQRNHVLGTLPYRWETNNETASLIKLTFPNLAMFRVQGSVFVDPQIPGSHKACLIKDKLGIPSDKPLMANVSRPLLIHETETECELVFPHSLLAKLEYQQQVMARFRRHKSRPLTTSWSVDGKNWKRWGDENDPAVAKAIPDLLPTWQNPA